MSEYKFNKKVKKVKFCGKKSAADLDIEIFRRALNLFDKNVTKLEEYADGLFPTLGMRNLSAFIGEIFAAALSKSSDGFLMKNPHQDGYPDLLVMTYK